MMWSAVGWNGGLELTGGEYACDRLGGRLIDRASVCCVGLAGLAAWLGIKGETMLN